MQKFTPVILTLLTICVSIGLSSAQSLSPYTIDAVHSRSTITFLDVDESVVLPKGDVTVLLPNREGKMISVDLQETHIMPPALAARYPSITSYSGLAADGTSVSVTQGNDGVHVYANKIGEPSWEIEPISPNRARSGLTDDLSGDIPGIPLSCGYDGNDAFNALPANQTTQKPDATQQRQVAVEKRVFIVALACTGEFGRRYGGTKASVMQTYVQGMGILNNVTLREIAAEFQLHPNTDTLIFTDPSTDPYIQTALGGALLSENPVVINSRINVSEYDVGHVFTNSCTDVGGVVSGRACDDGGKARGVTCHYTSLTNIIEDVMAHEVAHQFAVSHSWNNCPGSDGQRAGIGAYEPGSGSTIMSYQGACGSANNVSNINSPVYYHVGSLQQFRDYITIGGGATCADVVATTNDLPVIDWPYSNGFAIPRSTPFVLSATATDPDGDNLLYNWEQYDRGPAVPLCTARDDSPLFRSLPPNRNGNTRFFPDLNTVITNGTDCEELLPEYGRDLNFRMIVRDRQAVAGGTVWEQVGFEVAENAGPFKVTSQTSLATTYAAGEFVTVTWDVANTDIAPVSCAKVNIFLSMDNGRTYDFQLATETNNDGSEGVTIPAVEGSSARIKVESVDNIFYSLSPSRFTIVEPTEPGFTFVPSETTTFLCLPQNVEIDLFTSSLLGYTSDLTLDIVSSVPSGIVATILDTDLSPGESTKLVLDFSGYNETDSVFITVRASGDGVPDATRELLFDVVSNDFSDLQLLSPSQSMSGVEAVPVFTFTESAHAREHTLEISTDPRFGLGTTVVQDPDPSGETLDQQLEPNTVYFWRVVPKNRCGEDLDAKVNAFHTFAANCQTFSKDSVILIPPRIRRTVEAVIPISQSGPVSDLNLPLVNVLHADINDIRIKLESPSGQSVVLLENRCGGTNRLITGFDDESPNPFSCSPSPTDGLRRQPLNPLSAFNGTDIQGDWKLQVEVVNPSNDGGEFRAFAVEFCADIVSLPPTLDLNTVGVPTGQFQYLDRTYISANDPDNDTDDLRFVLVREPTAGHLELYGLRLEVGGRWNMSQAQTGGLTYVHDGTDPGTDNFSIVLSDNAGNIVATPVVDVEIGDDFAVSTEDPTNSKADMTVAPNPTTDVATVRWPLISQGGELTVLDVQGRVLRTLQVEQGQQNLELDMSAAPRGIYLLNYRGADGVKTLRLVRQ